MSTTTNVLLAIRAAHRPSEPRDEEHEQLRDDQVPRSRPPRYPWPIRRIRDGELHDAQTAQPGEKLERRHACGPELPEAAERTQDVLELLTARVTGTDDHDWMEATAQHAAQVYASVIRAQPLLAVVAPVIPRRSHPDAEADQARLVELAQQGHLAAAATAAARARAVQEWAGPENAAVPDRIRAVEAGAPGARTLRELNETLSTLDPALGSSAFTALDPERVAEVVGAIGQLSARMRTIFRTASALPPASREQSAPQRPQHQQPPTPGQSPSSSTPRAAP